MTTQPLTAQRPADHPRALRTLFAVNVLVLSAANGLFPLLPLYLLSRGLQPSGVGLLMALAYLAMAGGIALSAGQTRTGTSAQRFTLNALGGGVLLIAMGYPLPSWAAGLLLIGAWGCLGQMTALVNAAVAQWSVQNARGSAYSGVLLAAPLGALIGSAVFASLADRVGFGWVFAVAGLAWLVAPLFWPRLGEVQPSISVGPAAGSPPYRQVRALIGVALLLMSAVFAGRMTLALAIAAAGLPVRAAGEIGALGGLVMLGGLPLLGRLADRFGAQRILAAIALSCSLGCGLLMIAQTWVLLAAAGVFLAGAAYGAGTLLCVCAIERAPNGSGGAAVMLVTAAFWGAAVISFLGAGALAERLSLPMLAGICAAFALTAAATLLVQRGR